MTTNEWTKMCHLQLLSKWNCPKQLLLICLFTNRCKWRIAILFLTPMPRWTHPGNQDLSQMILIVKWSKEQNKQIVLRILWRYNCPGLSCALCVVTCCGVWWCVLYARPVWGSWDLAVTSEITKYTLQSGGRSEAGPGVTLNGEGARARVINK